MVITKISNMHIHNSNSACCWNRYPIKIVYQEAKKANLKYFGSTNHVFPPLVSSPDGRPEDVFQRHLEWTKEEIESLKSDIPFYLGAELDIIDHTGNHFLLPKYEKLVDYWIAGMHSFFKKETMIAIFNKGEQDDFLPDYFEEWGEWAEIYIRKSRPSIFVHPFWQELEFGIIHEKAMLETAQRVFDAAASVGTAIECSSLQMRNRFFQAPFWLPNDPRGDPLCAFNDIYTKLFKIAKELGCLVSFGSDAHIPEQIKDVIRIKTFLEGVGFSDKDIFEPTYR